MNKLRWISTAIIVGMGALIIAALTYYFMPPPTVLGSDAIASTRTIGANAPFHVSFSTWMQQSSVEELFTIDPPLEGNFSWESNSLFYTPTQMLQEGDTYMITIGAGAKSTLGKTTATPYQLHFTVTAPPEVTFAAPQDTVVAYDQVLTIMFSAPMVAVETIDANTQGELLMDISPNTAGSYRWLDTQTLQFKPHSGLVPSSDYTVTIQKGSKSADGGSTLEDYTFQFATEAPRILSTNPSDGYNLAGPPTPIAITFNQPVSTDVLSQYLTITPETPYQVQPDGQDLHTLLITPQPAWAFATAHTLTIGAGLPGTQGSKTLEEPFTIGFSTVGTPQLLEQSPKADETDASIYGLALTFNTTLPQDALKDKLTISPALEHLDLSHQEGESLYYDATFAHSTTYEVTIPRGIQDIYGQTLTEDIRFSFTTMDRPASISLDKREHFNLFSGYDPIIHSIKTVNLNEYQAELCAWSMEEFLTMSVYNTPSSCGNAITWTEDITAEKNTLNRSLLNMEERYGAPLTAGVYSLRVWSNAIEGDSWRSNDYSYFFVTNTALTLKSDANQVIALATDIRTGAPVPNMELALITEGSTVQEGRTDTNGMATLTYNGVDGGFYVVGTKGTDTTISSTSWRSGIAPWDFDINEQMATTGFVGYMFSDRPIYRPSHTVHLTGMVRSEDDAVYSIPAGTVNITVEDSQYTTIHTETVPLNDNGTFAMDLVLPASGNLGQYHVQWQVDNTFLNHGGYYSFFVEEYKAPEFEVVVTPDKPQLFSGEPFRATVQARYFFGGTMGNVDATWTLTRSNYYFNKYTDGWYNFMGEEAYQYCDYGHCGAEDTVVSEGTITLNERGIGTITVPITNEEALTSGLYTLEVTVRDAGEQRFSGRTTIPWHMGRYYIGMRNQQYVVASNEVATFDLITVDTAGTPMGDQSLSVEYFRREWRSVQKNNVDGAYYWETETIDTPVSRSTVTTDQQGKATSSFTPSEGGYYIAKATGTDQSNNTIRSMAGIYVADDSYSGWGQTNNNRITLVADQKEYSIGDTATILIPSPFEQARALVTYERGTIFHSEVLTLGSGSKTIEVPITEDFLPNSFVSVLLIKDTTAMDPSIPRTAEFRMGYAALRVNTKEKELSIQLSTDKERYLPGEEVALTITTTDHTGQAVDGEVALAVVDASVLALKANASTNLMEEFYFQRGLGVLTGTNLTIYTDTINVAAGAAKGGGGGDDALDRKHRGEFKDTAYWNPSIRTQNGRAVVTFTLPDNLTTWHMTALGITGDTKVGSQELDVLASKELLLRPITPRFLRFQDRVSVGASIYNSTTEDQRITVTLASEQLDLKSNEVKNNILVKAGEEITLTWNAQVLGSTEGWGDTAVLSFKAENDQYQDSTDRVLPIYHVSTPEVVSLMGEATDARTELIRLPSTIHPTLGQLSLTLSNTLVGSLETPLTALIAYPYECVEQITSRLLSTILLQQHPRIPASRAQELMEYTPLLQDGVALLYNAQRSDGSWGFWIGSSTGSPYLSAYTTMALHELQGKGVTVDSTVLRNASAYLQTTLRNASATQPLSLEERAYITYVLAAINQGDLAYANTLYDQREQLSTEGFIYLLRTYQLFGNERATTMLANLANQALPQMEGRSVSFANQNNNKSIMSSDVRTTALALEAFVAGDPNHPLVPRMVQWLQSQERPSLYRSTQDRIHTLRALHSYIDAVEQSAGPLNAQVHLNNNHLHTASLSSEQYSEDYQITIDQLLRDTDNTLTLTGGTSDQPLYYQGYLEYYLPTQDIAPLNRGFSIRRDYYHINDTELTTPISYATKGDTLKAVLTIVVPTTRHHVAVESYLPAGFEGVNFNLDTTEQALEELITQEPNSWWTPSVFHHTEVREDRILLFADELAAGVYNHEYLVTVTTEGIFNHPPARIYEMYYPEIFGRSKGSLINIR